MCSHNFEFIAGFARFALIRPVRCKQLQDRPSPTHAQDAHDDVSLNKLPQMIEVRSDDQQYEEDAAQALATYAQQTPNVCIHPKYYVEYPNRGFEPTQIADLNMA